MAFCGQCGNKLADGDVFCSKCGKRNTYTPVKNNNAVPVNKPPVTAKVSETRDTVFAGPVLKCPNCGSVINGLTSQCPSCGMELNAQLQYKSITSFIQQLDKCDYAISRSRNVASRNIFTGKRELSPEEKRKLSIIENAQIENSRGAMSEILLYISSMVTYYASSSTDPQNEVWMDAWKKKADSIYHNALVLFPDDQIMLKAYEDIESDYSLFQMKLKHRTKSDRTKIIIAISASVLALVLLGVLASIGAKRNRLSLIRPDEELVFTNLELASYLPELPTNVGNSLYETPDYLSFNLSNISKDQFNDYVSACRVAGFTSDGYYSSYSSFFSAEHPDGVSLSLSYLSYSNQMDVSISFTDDYDPDSSATSSTSSTTTTAISVSSASSSGEEVVLELDGLNYVLRSLGDVEYLIPQQWIVYSEQTNSIKYYNEDTTMMAEILFVATARSISDDDFTDWFLGRLSVDPADAIIHETYMGITHPARSYMFLVDNSMTDQVNFVIVSDCEGGVVICSIGYEGDNAARASVIISNIVDSFSIPDR